METKRCKYKKGSFRMMIFSLFCIVAVVGIFRFHFVKKEAKKRIVKYEAMVKVAYTSYGRVSYIDEGQGEPFLICHGICGGYDQAYDTLANGENRYRILAPSRFGYPGSDIPRDATIEMQVEAFRELLDQLGIEKTYVLGTSAGGATAIKFALMYPERINGLILYCSGYPTLKEPEKKITYAGPPSFMCNDFFMWLVSPLFKPLMGMEPETLKVILPMQPRKKGIVFDARVSNTVMVNDWTEYDMSKLEIPVLVIHAKDDKMADFKNVEPWIDRIKDCTFIALDSGGHLMEGNSKKIDKAVKDFITKQDNL